MRLISVNVGLPRTVRWKGRSVTTGIFKEPVCGSLAVSSLNLTGDKQADLSVHGGSDKAVYGYPSEHYDFWRREFPTMQLPWGMFGENLTTEGLFEDEVNIGDRFQVGSVELTVTQPRLPCYKLGIKFGRDDIIKRFLESGLTGFYFAVSKEGLLKAGDQIERIAKQNNSITVLDITRLYADTENNIDMLRRVVHIDALSQSWRRHFQRKMEELKG
jgi:MOSC domain-containing protein YiiM